MSARRDGGISDSADGISDRVLAAKVQEGDRAAFERLVRLYMRPVSAIASSLLRQIEEVDDAVQDTFLRVLERIHLYNPRRPFAPWIYQVARNVARNRWRTNHRAKRRSDDVELAKVPVADDTDSPDNRTEISELRRYVEKAIEELPERQRVAVRLHDIEGFKAQEIAEFLGVSDGTVRANLHHARKTLRARLKPIAREWI